MKKLKLDEVIEKAIKIFRNLKGKKTILTGEGLTRKELRILERKGLVKKIPVYKEKKYKDNPSTMTYAWEWVGASEQ